MLDYKEVERICAKLEKVPVEEWTYCPMHTFYTTLDGLYFRFLYWAPTIEPGHFIFDITNTESNRKVGEYECKEDTDVLAKFYHKTMDKINHHRIIESQRREAERRRREDEFNNSNREKLAKFMI